jgi:RNA polymerase sigma factor (sigma-70 family)
MVYKRTVFRAPSQSIAAGSARDFRTTHWSLVLAAGHDQSLRHGEALETLCRTYWPAIYAFVRRRGYDEHAAKDLTQAFFARVLEKNYFGDADARRGRFRTFLLTSLNHFLANEWDKSQRQKRGGGATVFSLDERDEEGRFLREPIDSTTPEKTFDRRWAHAVLERVLDRLQREFDGKEQRFEHLKIFLLEPKGSVAYADVALRLGMTEQSVKSAIHRMRRRYAEIFRDEIAQTVTAENEVEEEIRDLFAALSG